MVNLPNPKESTKAAAPDAIPTPPSTVKSKTATPQELKQRLDWGEPALTIIDARTHEAFSNERIMGAVSMPVNQITQATEDMQRLEYNRDIYVYGEDNEQTAEAANQLRQAGYESVAELEGGLSAWKSIEGSTEGIYAFPSPAKNA